jgi:hydrogenase expression/formation protein HypC
MCIALPMQVIEAGEAWAWCDDRGQRTQVDVRLIEPVPVGAWLLVFHGVARECIDAGRAADVARAIEGVEAAMRGDVVLEHHFADLIGREPELPEFLRPAAAPKEASNG